MDFTQNAEFRNAFCTCKHAVWNAAAVDENGCHGAKDSGVPGGAPNGQCPARSLVFPFLLLFLRAGVGINK